jgi:branched-chain amino acid aminotransferase
MVERRELMMYLNGQVMPHSRGVAMLQSREFQSNSGFYDHERTFGGRVFKLRQHLERLYRGLTFSKLDPGMTLEEMEATTLRLLEDNRPLLAPGGEFMITQVVSLGAAAPPGAKPSVNVVIYFQPLDFASFARSYIQGVQVVTPDTYGVPDQEALSSAKEGRPQVFPLMTSREGSITECAGGNFMFVREGRIKLPDRRNVLPGISMQTVLELAESLGVAVDEGDYSTYDVYLADEAFVSSTRFCLVPVATLNGLRLGGDVPGPITRKLMDAWRELTGVDFVQQALAHLR